MSKINELRERLVAALVKSAHAERVWRREMTHDARPENEGAADLDDRNRLDGLSRDRERAKDDVEALRAAIDDAIGHTSVAGRYQTWRQRQD